MLERGDLHTFHEPFLYLYYVHDAKKKLRHFEPEPGHPVTYEAIKRMLLEAAEAGPVFVKDMSYYVTDHVLGDASFIRRTQNTFLIRNPERSIPSYYKLDPKVTEEEIGLEAEHRHFERVRELTGRTPIVVDAEDVEADTEATMRLYCDALGIGFIPESLTWTAPVPQNWQHVAGWHTDLAQTKGIAKRTEKRLDLDAAPHLRRLYDHHLPHYRALRKHRLRPQ